MKKTWIVILVFSFIVNVFCIFYVAVGACTEVEEKEYSFPEEIEKERAALEKWLMLYEQWREEPAKIFFSADTPVTFTLYAPEYEGGWGTYEIEYTIEKIYTSDTLPEGMNTEKFADREFYREEKLKEGYTFLMIDAIIKNKSSKKQMYRVNSIDAGRGLLGFSGQTFQNTAIFHKELDPNEAFETTLVFCVEKENIEGTQIYINNFGTGSPDGNCAYIDYGG